MSNQCSNLLFNFPSFSPSSHIKPFPTTLRPIFPFHISRLRKSPLPPPLSAQSSSDIVLIATTQHTDGSLVFRFGDATEVVKNDEVVEDLESWSESESNIVKVLDGDQVKQVIVKTTERGYGSDDRRLTEVADGIRAVDSDVSESETNVISGLRDYPAEASERLSDVSKGESKGEALSSQSDPKLNNSFEALERTIDKTEHTVQLGGNESLNPTISLLDDSPNRDKSADPEGILLKDSDDETEDPLVSVNLESIQVLDANVMDVKQPYAKDELHNVKIEDASESDTKNLVPAETIHIADGELKDAANEDVEAELQDINIHERTLIDEMPPSNPLGVKPNLDVVGQLQSVHVKAEATTEVSSTKAVDVKDQAMEDELQQVSMQVSGIELEDTIGRNLDDRILQAIDKTDVSSVSVELETMSVSDDEVMDVTKSYTENEFHKVEPEETSVSDKKDLMPPATMYTSDIELRVASNEDVEEGLQDMNINEGTLTDGMPISNPLGAKPTVDEVTQLASAHVKVQTTMEVITTENMDVKDQPVENKLQQVSTNNGDENDVACVMPVSVMEEAEPILEEALSQPRSTPLELNFTMQVSDTELQDTMGQNLNDGVLQVVDETDDPSVSVKLESMQVSHAEVMDVTQLHAKDELHKVETEDTSESNMTDLMLPATMHISDSELPVSANEAVEERLLDININEGTLRENMPPVNTLGAEPTSDEPSLLKLEATKEVPNTKGMDGMNQAVEDELQQVSTDNGDENDVAHVISAESFLKEEVSQLSLTPVEVKPTKQVEDTTGQNLDEEILQVINEDAGDSYIKGIEVPSHQLEAQPIQDEGLNHTILEQCTETDSLGSSLLLEQDEHGSLLEAERMQGIVSSSEIAEASENSAILLTAETEVEREDIHLTGYFLSSGAALLEDPSKALAGGDDAYFVADSKWLGVANGVSQWSFEGTDPGVYAQVLMRTCEEIVLDTSRVPVTNPVELLCRGVKETKMPGSSNVLIANLDGQALHVANIGDTGFLIIRHGAVYTKSSPLIHEFHFALQVEDCDDPLQLVEEHKIELEEGDIVVYATDGLFDNLYEREIAMIVSKLLEAEMKPQEIANVLAIRAQEVGRSALVRSPFSDAAQAAGYTGYTGGKPDNVAVIVSLVEKRSNLLTD